MGGRGVVRRKEPDPYLQVTYEQCRSEAPEYLLVFAIMTLLGTIPIVFLDQVLGPSYALGNLVTVDDEKRKLGLVIETAQEVWGNH